VEGAISAKTCAIVGVHIYGMPCDLGALQGVASRRNLRLIYDGAHAFGTEIGGKSVLDFGDATILSFHATKLFNTAEGGAVVTRDKSVKEKIDLWRTLGIKDEVSVVLPGINARMNELEAALGLCNLKHVEKERSARSAVAAVYADRLGRLPGVNCFRIPQNVRNNHSYFVVRIDRERSPVTRDFLYEQLKTFNVFTRRYFYPLCSSFPCYSHLPSSDPRNLKVASRVAEEVLCFPLYGGLKTADADRICDIVDYIVGKADALRS
jgi:dTDP-4-amino-4,6-dideoxygalactose transaminase